MKKMKKLLFSTQEYNETYAYVDYKINSVPNFRRKVLSSHVYCCNRVLSYGTDGAEISLQCHIIVHNYTVANFDYQG
jgi:hypothetical protein